MTQRPPRIACLNPNTNDAATRMMVEIATAHAPKGWQVEGLTAERGTPLITRPDQLRAAAEAVAASAERLRGMDGAIVCAFGDPGLAALRARLRVPVAGLGEAAMGAAARIGRFGVATTTPELVAEIAAQAEHYGHNERFAGVRVTPGDPATVMADPDALAEALGAAVAAAVDEDGAEAVIIGGGPLAEAARRLAPICPVPLIAPVPAALAWLAERLGNGTETLAGSSRLREVSGTTESVEGE